jgi:hypothetical protein
MPCDSVQTTNVKLEVADLGLLADALRALGYSVDVRETSLSARHAQHGTLTYDKTAQRLSQTTSYSQTKHSAAEIGVAYSTQVVKKVASKFGWQLEQTKTKANEVVRFTAKKRSF